MGAHSKSGHFYLGAFFQGDQQIITGRPSKQGLGSPEESSWDTFLSASDVYQSRTNTCPTKSIMLSGAKQSSYRAIAQDVVYAWLDIRAQQTGHCALGQLGHSSFGSIGYAIHAASDIEDLRWVD